VSSGNPVRDQRQKKKTGERKENKTKWLGKIQKKKTQKWSSNVEKKKIKKPKGLLYKRE